MRLLPDTHAFLWFIMGDPRLSAVARAAIEHPDHVKYVSAASAWEIAIKVSLGKLTLAEAYDVLVRREILANGFEYLPIELAHTARVLALPFPHRDPFDRMLIAQALVEGMQLVSTDPAIDAYGVSRIW
jgi:PIN domain nuclease of toxin-antitoxin system